MNECERRPFLGTKTITLREQGFSISISKIMEVIKNTLYKRYTVTKRADNV